MLVIQNKHKIGAPGHGFKHVPGQVEVIKTEHDTFQLMGLQQSFWQQRSDMVWSLILQPALDFDGHLVPTKHVK